MGKTALSAATKPSLDLLRLQFARRGSVFADLSTLAGADRELNEAITVLEGRADNLPGTVLAKLKGLASGRPDSFGGADARRFVEDGRVAELVKSGARRTLRGEDVVEERAAAHAIHSELFGDDGFYGETLIEDAIAFAALTLIGHLTPADRQTIELIVDVRSEVRAGFDQVLGEMAGLRATVDAGPLDGAPFDDVVRAEIRKLRRRRMLNLAELPDSALALGTRIETGLRLASPGVRAEAYREIAVVLIRADRVAEAEPWIGKSETLGGDVICERARIAISRGQVDDALRMLRERGDAPSRSLLMDAIARRDGDVAALSHFDAHLGPQDLTGHALQATASRMLSVDRARDAAALLRAATAGQIDENPVLLFMRARQSISRAVPPDVAKRLLEHEGIVPRPTDLHDDAEGRRHLAMARVDLQLLQPALPELGSHDLSVIVDLSLVFLGLCASDPGEAEIARAELVARMKGTGQTELLAPLATLYGVDVDWGPLKARLVAAEKLGGLDDTQLRAAFAIVMHENDPAAIADFAHRHRERLELFSINERVVAIEIEALAKSGRMGEAKALLSAERTMLGEGTASFLEAGFSELEGADTIPMRLAQFEASGSTHDLEILAELMRQRDDPRLGEHLVQLWRRRRQVGDAQHACDVLVRTGDEERAETFLDELGGEACGDATLRTHLAWGRYRQGRLSEAEIELGGLRAMGVDDHNTRHLTVMLAIETGRWSELETFVQRQLAARVDRSAEELIAAARIARSIGSAVTMDLVRAAVAKDPTDALIALQGYNVATEAGSEETAEVGGWLRLAIADKERSGLVEKSDLNELVAMMRGSRAEADRIGGLIDAAEVPLFMGMGAMGGTQSALVIRQMAHNASEADSRRRAVVPLFAGNPIPRADARPKAISLDPLAILVLDQLGLLEVVLGAFGEVVLPSGTLHSFFEDRGKAAHSQPSRVAQARRIKNAVAGGLLTVERLPAPVVSDVDAALAALLAAAADRDGFVVHTCPLRPPGRFDEVVDPLPYAGRLISPRGLVRALRSAGTLSRTAANAADAAMAGSGEAFDDEPVPERGKPIFLTDIAVQYLSDAGLLPDLKAHAGDLVAPQGVIDRIDREIDVGAAAEQVRAGIERVRDTLSRAIAEGRARVGPARRSREEVGRKPERGDRVIAMSPVVSVLRDSAGIDAFVCDDRAINKHLEITDRAGHAVAFLTTADLLGILRGVDAIDDDAVDAAREKLRRSGAGLMPVDPEELARAMRESDWMIGPSAELRAIRDSIHLPLGRRMVQMPSERPWLRAVSLSIAYAIRDAWLGLPDDDDAERAADYLLGLLPDPVSWNEGDPSPDRQAWVSEVTRHWLWAISALFSLPASRVERYRRWFATRVERFAARCDPGALEGVARALYSAITSPLEDAGDHDASRPPSEEERRSFIVATLQKLPEAISRLILADAAARADVNLPVEESLRVFGRRFEKGALLRSLRNVANGRPVALVSVDGTLAIDEARIEDDGTAVLVAGDQAARFANVGTLSDDHDRRASTSAALLTSNEIPADRAEQWRAAIETGPLDDELFQALETMLESSPESVYRRLIAALNEGTTYDVLVPDESNLFEGLLGIPPPDTLGEYRREWLAAAASLDAGRRARRIALAAPLSAMRGNLVATAAASLDRDLRLRLARFLARAPDPLSQVAAFQLAVADHADPEFRPVGDEVLARLLDQDDEQSRSANSFLSAAVVLTATVCARRGTLEGWPPYARRLAWLLHASHLTRIFGTGQIGQDDMQRDVARPFAQHHRLVELCDATVAPFNLTAAPTPARLRAVVLASLTQILESIASDERPDSWSSSVAAAGERFASGPEALLYHVAGPLDPFEDDWEGPPTLPEEVTNGMLARMKSGTDAERVVGELFNLAIACEIGPEERSAFAEHLSAFVGSLPDETFAVAADCSLQLAARWKLPVLSESVIDLALGRAASGDLQDLGTPPRFSLLGAASSSDPEQWARKVGEYAKAFAFALQPGPGIVSLLAALELIGDFAPPLRAAVAPARSFCLLAQDHLPSAS